MTPPISPPCTVAYNNYVDVIGHSIGAGACANVRRQGKMYHIEDDTKLIHFLSEEEEGTANDWLYIVIADIVSLDIGFRLPMVNMPLTVLQVDHHNSFLKRVFDVLNAPEHSTLRVLFPDGKAEVSTSESDLIYPTEVNNQACIVGAATR